MGMIHHVFANRSNAGDWLSAIAIQQLVARPVVEHLCDEPFIEETLDALASTTAHDVIVIGGGGLLMDYFDDLWIGLVEIDTRAPIVLWGLGACDMKYEATRPNLDAVRSVAARADICVVRDHVSQHVVAQATRLPVPCPSVAAIPRSDAMQRGVLHVGALDTTGDAAYFDARAVCMGYASHTDREFRETSNRFQPDSRAGLEAVLQAYRSSDVIVSARLHGCILAVATGRPVIAISGDWKIEAFMDAVGLGDWVLDCTDLAALPDQLARLAEQPPTDAFVRRAVADNRSIGLEVAKLARRLAG